MQLVYCPTPCLVSPIKQMKVAIAISTAANIVQSSGPTNLSMKVRTYNRRHTVSNAKMTSVPVTPRICGTLLALQSTVSCASMAVRCNSIRFNQRPPTLCFRHCPRCVFRRAARTSMAQAKATGSCSIGPVDSARVLYCSSTVD